jgi:type IX secretion system substrate protein
MKKSLLIILLFIAHYSLLITNCYAQWIQQSVPVIKPITGIKFIDSLKGWAITSYGTQQDTGYVLHTTNSGVNWNVQYKLYRLRFDALFMVNDTLGYVSADSIGLPKLLKTINGGINWNFIPISFAIFDMQFINKDSGWVCNGVFGPDVRTTTDGGQTWQLRINGFASQTEHIFFLNYNTGYCGARWNLYKTSDAGLNWNLLYNFGSDVIYSIYFLDDLTGWVGYNRIYKTTNGGINFEIQPTPPNSSAPIYNLYFINSLTGWGTTGFGKIFKTTNGGTNWGYQLLPDEGYSISVVDSLKAWAGYFGIFRTTNGGGPILAVQQISSEIPVEYKLYQNYPNPFNPTTNIKYQLTLNDKRQTSNVKLIIYDVLGREITVLVNEQQHAGTYLVTWNAENYPTGSYFSRLIIDGKTLGTGKMILVK